MGWKDKLKNASLPEASVRLVMAGDLMAEHEKITAELGALEGKPAGSLAGSPRKPLETKLAALESAMRDSIITVRMRALPRSRKPGDDRPTFRDLAEKHPPRVDTDGVMDPRDRLNGGINSMTFPEVLVRACLADIDGDDVIADEDWDEVVAAISEGQFQELLRACWDINRNTVNVPFLLAGSRQTGTIGAE